MKDENCSLFLPLSLFPTSSVIVRNHERDCFHLAEHDDGVLHERLLPPSRAA